MADEELATRTTTQGTLPDDSNDHASSTGVTGQETEEERVDVNAQETEEEGIDDAAKAHHSFNEFGCCFAEMLLLPYCLLVFVAFLVCAAVFVGILLPVGLAVAIAVTTCLFVCCVLCSVIRTGARFLLPVR